MYRLNLKVSAIKASHTRSMEYAIWKVKPGTVTINTIAIYHSPYSDINQSTNEMFLDDLADIFEKHLMPHSNIMVTGDVNLQIDKMTDPDVNPFKDMIQAFGIDYQVDFPTHWSDHTFDLILTEVIDTSQCQSVNLEYSFQTTAVANILSTSRKLNWRGKSCHIGKLMLSV